MPRYKLTIEYDGTPFVGWQAQTNGLSVQKVVEDAIKGFCGEDLKIYGAGRTDAGVHALGQVAHVDFPRDVAPDTLRDAVNAHMRPHPVAIVEVLPVPDSFEARFSAVKRHYMYRIVNRRAPLTLDRGQAWLVHKRLDTDAMHAAAQALVGKHDFTTFRSVQCQAKSPLKTVDEISVSRYADEIEIICRARSFLHNQVRSFVGTLRMVGEGRWTARTVEKALAAKDRSACGPVAPPDGLYLLQVDYE
ncbi:MAG: tRNA pseudouridine(38-40) synthase TruA [Parvibaculum sp.]|nr:tRNA pseudouridine(38-40) synthase TruA [Parvibaculum sp.]